MVKPNDLHTKILLDGGNQAETAEICDLLGWLDGQTTNPSLIAKHPAVQRRLASGQLLTRQELLAFYREVVTDIAALLPDGTISIEVYADRQTTTAEMIAQAQEMYTWIANARIKLPTNQAGLAAASELAAQGMRINMTLCFSQSQAAAVYAATVGAAAGQVVISPFVGRLDDRGEDGMQLISNILRMLAESDGHLFVLTASIRSLPQLLQALHLSSPLATVPADILKAWAATGCQLPPADFRYQPEDLQPIAYQQLSLGEPWQSFDIMHELTNVGIDRFASDWNSLLEPEDS